MAVVRHGIGRLLLQNHRQFLALLRVECDILLVLRRQIFQRENGLLGALRDTGRAIDALVRIDPQPGVALVKTVDRTNGYTHRVFTVDTTFSHYVGHGEKLRHSADRGNGSMYTGQMFFYLLILFISMPLLEIALLLRVGDMLGFSATLGLVIVTGILGASLARWQGGRQLLLIQQELRQGRTPGLPLIDGVLILIAGIVLLTPGLITDACGFFLLIPPGRAAVRNALQRHFKKRFVSTVIDVDSWHEP